MTNARVIQSNQDGVHSGLVKTVERHLAHEFRAPFADYSLELFEKLKEAVRVDGRPIVLDSCCGVGESTVNLAKRHTDAFVIGLDKSAARVEKHHSYQKQFDNYLVVRGNLNDLWRLMVTDGWQPTHHYLLYPNPWPKSAHLQRRWHGGALFPYLIKLGGQLTVRSNWLLYLQEFEVALSVAGKLGILAPLTMSTPLTPFERKYHQSQQPLFQLTADLSH